MPSPEYNAALSTALDICGVQPDFWDIFGHQRFASEETKRAILSALGIDCTNTRTLRDSIDARMLGIAGRVLPPCTVTGQSGSIPLHVPIENECDMLAVETHWEDGSIRRAEIRIKDLVHEQEIQAGGRRWLKLSIPVASLCGCPPPLGYHKVKACLCSESCEMWLIVTPERAWIPGWLGDGRKSAGLAVQLYGIRNDRNWGCGDFSDIGDVAKWAHEMGATFLALNPLHAIHNRRPYNTSPYLPFSLLYRNYLYLDVERLPEYTENTRLRRKFESAAIQAELKALRECDFVEYERVAALKLYFLRRAFAYGMRRGIVDRASLAEWREGQGIALERFATYCALDEYMHRRNPDIWIWPDWPAEYQDPDSKAVAAFRERHARNIEFYCYLQWRIDQQAAAGQDAARAAGLPIGLYHDLPLATDRFGCELWAHRDCYMSGCRVGSPPDDFSPKGQDWGFPPPNRDFHRASGYRHYVATIRAAVRHGGALRIDHVMRLFRLYWIPDEVDASRGAYVRDNWEDLVRILALESVRKEFFIVGEDLGTVEPWVREALGRFGILSYRLLYFERADGGRFKRPDEYTSQALVSTTTHDLPTLAGFWTSADIEARRSAGVLDEAGYRAACKDRARDKDRLLDALRAEKLLPAKGDFGQWSGAVRDACVGYLARSPAMLLAINHEDLSGEVAQQNLPGTTAQYPNWARKMRQSPVEMAHADATGAVRALLERTRRTLPAA
jgi:4-alpha-glucanotransferase